MKKLFTILFLSACCLELSSQPMRAASGSYSRTGDDPSPPSYDTSYTQLAQFNTKGPAGSDADGWQNLTPQGNPNDAVRSGTQNGITLSTNTTGAWNGIPATVGQSGETSNDGGGFAHNATVQSSYYFNASDTYSGSTSDACLRVSGLQEDSIYVVEIVSSRATGAGNRFCTYIMHDKNGQGPNVRNFSNGDTLNATGNTSKVVRLFGKADSDGYLYVWGGGTNNTGDTDRFGFFNSVRIFRVTITEEE